jgi:adenosine deaminase
MTIKLDDIRQIPKVLLHDHLDGGIRAQTIIDLAYEMNIALPENNAAKLSQWFYTESTAHDLKRCLDSFSVSCSVMQTENALERIAYETVADLAADGIVYFETRFCPTLHTQKGLTYLQIINSVICGLEKGKKDFDVEYGLLLCGMYNFSDEINLQIAEICYEYLGHGVVGFDFAGAETESSLDKQSKTLAFLQKKHIPLTVHSGEVAGLKPIINAINIGAKRIGHGCMLFKDTNTELIDKTIQQIIKQNIHIEINILSNIGTGAIENLCSHPVKKFLDAGVSVALNTDDRLMFNNTLSSEYYGLANLYNMGIADIKQMNINAIKASFASLVIKNKIHDKIINH